MKEIPLTLGKVALVDDEDFDALSAFKWHAQRRKHTFYAVHGCTNDQRGQQLIMHRVILNAPKGIEVDHKNRNGLDNRRENIRLATRPQNCQNMGISTRNNSGYKGVHFDRSHQKWRAAIRVNTKPYALGNFDSAIEAARVYDSAARYYFKEFACLNFPAEKPQPFVPRPRRTSQASIYRGVWLLKGKWAASISLHGQRYHLGTYETEVGAAKAYDVRAGELFGDKARLNF